MTDSHHPRRMFNDEPKWLPPHNCAAPMCNPIRTGNGPVDPQGSRLASQSPESSWRR
jgi:hypothetical protein